MIHADQMVLPYLWRRYLDVLQALVTGACLGILLAGRGLEAATWIFTSCPSSPSTASSPSSGAGPNASTTAAFSTPPSTSPHSSSASCWPAPRTPGSRPSPPCASSPCRLHGCSNGATSSLTTVLTLAFGQQPDASGHRPAPARPPLLARHKLWLRRRSPAAEPARKALVGLPPGGALPDGVAEGPRGGARAHRRRPPRWPAANLHLRPDALWRILLQDARTQLPWRAWTSCASFRKSARGR